MVNIVHHEIIFIILHSFFENTGEENAWNKNNRDVPCDIHLRNGIICRR